MNCRTGLLTLALALIAGLPASADAISILGDGSSFAIYEETLNFPALRSLGQTFVIPGPASQNILQSFSFSVDFADSGLDYRAYIFQWDSANTRATGPALFTSGALTNLQAPSFSGLA